MANKEQLIILQQGAEVWNKWRDESNIPINLIRAALPHANLARTNLRNVDLNHANLSGANLRKVDFYGANLRGASLCRALLIEATLDNAILIEANLNKAKLLQAHLRNADLRGAILEAADFRGANLQDANLTNASVPRTDLGNADLRKAILQDAVLSQADLVRANLSQADLRGADLGGAILNEANLSCANLDGANLRGADLTRANLNGANLMRSQMAGTILQGANLSNCRIYGISAWNVDLEGAIQSNLIITKYGEPVITVDNLEVAQFIYLLINNPKLRDIIDTITTKAVLILGRFTDERKTILDAIREELRGRNYTPILFDFEKPVNRDLTETVTTLAHLSRFVIADLTDPSSIPHELATIVPQLRTVAIRPIIQKGQQPYGMFRDFQTQRCMVQPIYEYESQAQLIAELTEKVIEPAETKVNELRSAK